MNPEGATGQPRGTRGNPATGFIQRVSGNLEFMRSRFPVYQSKIFVGVIWENPDRTWITEPCWRRWKVWQSS